jgi:small subunit ribosomal protein S5
LPKRNFRRTRPEPERFNIEAWQPTTELGKLVKAGQITSIEQIFAMGKRIDEVEIVNALLPEIKSEIIDIGSVQRMTRNNRKMKFRVTAVAGDGHGHIGVGAAKDTEIRAAIDAAVNAAKRNMVPVVLGCGSWQCTCGQEHSLPFAVHGKCGGVSVLLKPAPRGLGVVASGPVKTMLELAGVKDIWSFSTGRTRMKYNRLMAVQDAIESILRMKNLSASTVAKQQA